MWSPFLCPVGLWEACGPQGVALVLCWGFQSSLDNHMLCLQAAVTVWVLAKMIMETEGTVFDPSSDNALATLSREPAFRCLKTLEYRQLAISGGRKGERK